MGEGITASLHIKYVQFVADSFLLGGRYRFNEQTFGLSKEKTKISCMKHGEFWQIIGNHIGRFSKCPECSKELVGRKSRLSTADMKKKVQENLSNNVEILKLPLTIKGYVHLLCKIHNKKFKLQASGIIYKNECKAKCPECLNLLPLSDLIADSFLQSKGRFKLFSEGSGKYRKLTGWCIKHEDFTAGKSNLTSTRWGCPRCNTERAARLSNRSRGITVSQAVIDLFYYTRFRGSIVKSYKHYTDVVMEIACGIHNNTRITWKTSIKGGKGSRERWGCQKCSSLNVTRVGSISNLKSAAIRFYAAAAKYNPHMRILENYKGSGTTIRVKCNEGHVTEIPVHRLIGERGFKTRCETCFGKHNVSQPEMDIRKGLDVMGIEYIANSRTILGTGKELDIYIPERSLAIEYNGVNWHSEKFNSDKYNLNNKRISCEKLGIRLLNLNSSDSFKINMQIIMSAIGCDAERYFARKCEVRTGKITDEIKELLNTTHIQGSLTGVDVYSLHINNRAIAAMCFSAVNSERGRKADNSRKELRRYTSYGNVVGGASRLLKAFTRAHTECREVISYSDNRLFTGGMYEKLGFTMTKETKPDYGYTRNGQYLYHKSKFQKSKLLKREDIDFNPEETEYENCLRNGWYRFWDCGKKKWSLTL